MGVNNKQRRAAKKRRRGSSPKPGAAADRPRGDAGWDSADAYGLVELQAVATLRRMLGRKVDDTELGSIVASLRRRIRPCPPYVLQLVLTDILDRQLSGATEGGWGRTELAQLVRRSAGDHCLPTLEALLDGRRLALDTDDGLGVGLRVAAVLASAPRLEPGEPVRATAADGDAGRDHPKLAQVQALLAKAESTDYDEEAEALSAKAQSSSRSTRSLAWSRRTGRRRARTSRSAACGSTRRTSAPRPCWCTRSRPPTGVVRRARRSTASAR